MAMIKRRWPELSPDEIDGTLRSATEPATSVTASCLHLPRRRRRA
jgi:hypothetical protein